MRLRVQLHRDRLGYLPLDDLSGSPGGCTMPDALMAYMTSTVSLDGLNA